MPIAVVIDTNGTNQSPRSRFPRPGSCCTRTNITISIPTSDIPASEPMIRRGSSDADSVYRPTMPIR